MSRWPLVVVGDVGAGAFLAGSLVVAAWGLRHFGLSLLALRPLTTLVLVLAPLGAFGHPVLGLLAGFVVVAALAALGSPAVLRALRQRYRRPSP